MLKKVKFFYSSLHTFAFVEYKEQKAKSRKAYKSKFFKNEGRISK